jgi:methylated-DNA-protein-cysteine methyltransferase-like protein
MPRTDEAEFWFNAVYSAVQEVPLGKVTSYGHIALLLGYRMFCLLFLSIYPYICMDRYTPYMMAESVIAQRPRQVGICLKHLSSDPEEYFHSGNVPWQRVINAKGMISHRYVLPSTFGVLGLSS